ncbi:hypothetical protein JZ751_000519 [Albula glossodonta]|uniref:Nuclear transcription factor Y subunit gamma n=1 Tax=Albula glossodonta TaxID=121402 RepID=A0A8T2PWK8_9TELE|nr:hypothetical protein JZ751_000519 [Albula glossodonta]
MSADNSFGAGSSDAQQNLQSFWPRVMEEIRNLTMKDFRVQELPLARIKKIMKLDEDVKGHSCQHPSGQQHDIMEGRANVTQGCVELTLRAWIHTEDNKRRTLQRNDIAMAITKFDQFDFLIDIVPRDELKPPKRQVQGQQQGQQAAAPTATLQPGQIIITQPQQGQVQLSTGQLQYIRLAQPVSGTQVVQGQIQTLATNAQQITQTEVQQGQQQFNQFTDGQQLYQIQQVTMPAGQELAQPMFIQSTSQTADGQVTTQVSAD